MIGFGLSNDERRGDTAEFGAAFGIAERAGLALLPHAGELLGAPAVAETLTRCDRTGSVTAFGVWRTPRCWSGSWPRGWRSRCAPGSNVALGVYAEEADVPLRRLVDAGATVALGADDPLIFGSRLADAVRDGSGGARRGRWRAGGVGARVTAGESGAL